MLAIITVSIFTGCNDINDLGMDLLPSTDLIKVKSSIIKDDISSFTFQEDSIRTDESGKSLLGSINDPVFGNTTINFATQFRLNTYPDFGENPVADSIKLFLYYRIIYGDTITPQKFSVYELESPLNVDASYYGDTDLKSLASDQIIGEIDYTPKVLLDSATTDTFYQLIVIPIDISLGQKLISADSLQMVNNDVFLEYFKGLYIESEKLTNEGGTILSLEASSSSSFQGSALLMYYNNDENKASASPDTMMVPYIITEFAARVNQYNHDYSGTAFENNLNSTTNQDSLIYIQSTGGLESHITIENLSGWQDSANVAINKAELIFTIDTIASEMEKFPPPTQLLFTVVNEDGGEYLPIDYLFSPAIYGGGLNEDYTYRFNITQHLQRIIDGETDNYGFFLTTAQKNSEARRVILKGSTSSTGIKIVISYSKFL